MVDEEKYNGLEVIGELDNWTHGIQFTNSGKAIPEVTIRFKPIESWGVLSIGEEACKQLDRLPPPGLGRYGQRKFARCRIDFYVEEAE